MQLNNVVRDTLADILAQEGRAILAEPLRCKALLKDYCPGYKAEVAALTTAHEERVPLKLLEGQALEPRSVLVPKLVRQLVQDRALDPAASHWAVEAWEAALRSLPPVLQVDPAIIPEVHSPRSHVRTGPLSPSAMPASFVSTPPPGSPSVPTLEQRRLSPIAPVTEWSAVWDGNGPAIDSIGRIEDPSTSENPNAGNAAGSISRQITLPHVPSASSQNTQSPRDNSVPISPVSPVSLISPDELSERVYLSLDIAPSPNQTQRALRASMKALFSPQPGTYSQLTAQAAWLPVTSGLLVVGLIASLVALRGMLVFGPFVHHNDFAPLPAMLLAVGSTYLTFFIGAFFLYLLTVPTGKSAGSFKVHTFLLALTYVPLRLLGLLGMLLFSSGHYALLILSAYQVVCSVQSVRATFGIGRGKAYVLVLWCLLFGVFIPLALTG